MLPHEHNLWVMLFEQTPLVFRWIFGILTLGIFWLLKAIYESHKARVNRIETLIKDNEKENASSLKNLHSKLDRVIFDYIDKK